MTRQQVYEQQQVYGKSYGGTPAENYQRFFMARRGFAYALNYAALTPAIDQE